MNFSIISWKLIKLIRTCTHTAHDGVSKFSKQSKFSQRDETLNNIFNSHLLRISRFRRISKNLTAAINWMVKVSRETCSLGLSSFIIWQFLTENLLFILDWLGDGGFWGFCSNPSRFPSLNRKKYLLLHVFKFSAFFNK